MKKLFTILSFYVAAWQTASAQITLTPASGYKVGGAFSVQLVDYSSFELSDTGANVTVDYSDVTTEGAVQTQNFVQPSTTPYAGSYPNATVAATTTSIQGVNAYAYYVNSATKLELIGVGSPQYVMTYSNPSTLITFPMSYNDSIYDEYKAQYIVNGVLVKRFGAMYQKADAYGNIKTPEGTFPYLRLYTVQEIVDSFFQDGQFISVGYSETYTFNYMNSNYTAPLFAYSEIYTEQGGMATASYNVGAPVNALKENTLYTSNENMFPNPATQNTINVAFTMNQNERVSFQIIDINGRVVKTIDSQSFTKGNHQMPLDIAALPSGFYSLLIGSEYAGTKAVKFAVQ